MFGLVAARPWGRRAGIMLAAVQTAVTDSRRANLLAGLLLVAGLVTLALDALVA